MENIKHDRSALDALLHASVAKVNAMSPAERDAMIEAQRESWVRGEMTWPKPNFHYENGVKVYHSYADYCAG